MNTKNSDGSITAAGLVIRALGLAHGKDDHWHTVTIHEHMQDALMLTELDR